MTSIVSDDERLDSARANLKFRTIGHSLRLQGVPFNDFFVLKIHVAKQEFFLRRNVIEKRNDKIYEWSFYRATRGCLCAENECVL